jgi:signal transduction histidine kinase
MILGAFALAVFGLLHERRSRELARLRGRFVANVSHELRTPLSQISMFAETLALRRERSAGEGREFAAIILAEARRLTALVESVLRFSRIESGRETLRLESASVAGEVSDAVDAFSPIAGAANVKIETHFADEPHARLDRAAFRQIVLNLLDNAVKHGGRGSLVGVSATRDNGDIRVTVDDSGPGVPADWRERVFEPFVRLESANGAGAGIGLAVVRDLVVAHGGTVWIEESPRGGARFVLTIPAERAPVPEMSPVNVEQHA